VFRSFLEVKLSQHCVLRVFDSIQIVTKHFLNQSILCLEWLLFSYGVIRFKLFIGVFESIHLASLVSDHCLLIHINLLWIVLIFIWTSWFDSSFCLCRFKLIQSSSGKCMIQFIVLDIRINLHRFQISSFYTISIDSCFMWFDSSLLFYFVNSFHSHLFIPLRTHVHYKKCCILPGINDRSKHSW